METSRPVVVKRVPERLNLREARRFQKEVQPFFRSDRPQIVFDMSAIKHLDVAGVDMLLHCMAEASSRDGDLKLASLSPQACVVLELTRTDRLFEIYETAADAVKSFSSFLPKAVGRFYPGPGAPPIVARGTALRPVESRNQLDKDGNEQAA